MVLLGESKGFEPLSAFTPSDFKSDAFARSANSPRHKKTLLVEFQEGFLQVYFRQLTTRHNPLGFRDNSRSQDKNCLIIGWLR